MPDDQEPSNDSAEGDKNEMQRSRKGRLTRSIRDLKRRTVLKGLGAGVGLGATGGFAIGTASALGVDEQVEIDIKPGSDPNAINCKKRGGTPVAVLTTDDFDATTVDPSSLRFGKPREVVEGGGAEIVHEGGHTEDVDDDDDTDFVGHFATQDTGFTADDTEGWLVGETTDGRRIVGSDTVKMVGKCPEEEEGLPEVGLGSAVEQTTDDVPSPGPGLEDPIELKEGFREGFEELKENAKTGDVQQPPEETIQKEGVPDAPSPPEGSDDDIESVSTDGGSAASVSIKKVTTQQQEDIETGEGFPAWENSELRVTPPDANLAVGPSKIVAAVNLRWGIYDKFSGNREFEVQLEDWWDPVLPDEEDFVFDPKALYDHHDDRFVLIAVAKNRPADTQGSWVVAVSDDSDPFGTWWITRIPHGVEGEWPDYPGFGVDENGIYLTANIFNSGFERSKLVSIDKTPLYNGNSFTYWWFGDVRRENGNRAFTIQPTHDMPSTSDGSTQWLVDSRANGGDELTLFELRNPTSTPRLFAHDIGAPQYGVPPDAEQPGTSATLDTVDARLMNAVYENGSVWTAHSINYDWNGDGDAEALLRWYELDTGGKSVTQVRGWGRPNGDYFFPTVASDGNSTMITYNESGQDPDTPVRIEVAGRTPDHTMNSLEDVAVIKYGESAAPGGRWGDYSGIVVDPGEGDTYYTIGQYANDDDTTTDWETWIGSAEFDEFVIE